jgi:hypothetical protein
MKRHLHPIRLLLAMMAASLAWTATAVPARAAECDRACLGEVITQYVNAVAAHDASRLPLAANVRFTEDSRELRLGDGLWKSVTRKGGLRQDYLDVERQIAAAHLVFFEGDTPVVCSAVLRVRERRVSGIETLVYRIPADAKNKPVHLNAPLPVMSEPAPADQRMSRAELIRVALSYTEGLRIGGFVKARTPFGPEAYRTENGVKYAGEGCVGAKDCAILTGHIMLHPDIGDTNSYGPNTALVTFEAFKIWGGSIRAVNAFLAFLPKDTERGWPSTDRLSDHAPWTESFQESPR